MHTHTLQEEDLNSVKKMMEVEVYDVAAVKGQLGEVLDNFMENLE